MIPYILTEHTIEYCDIISKKFTIPTIGVSRRYGDLQYDGIDVAIKKLCMTKLIKRRDSAEIKGDSGKVYGAIYLSGEDIM